MLSSISPISKVFQTSGSNPVKVLCSDVNDYVCKYTRSNPASWLFNEYIAAEFLRVWELKVPDSSIVTIKAEHLPQELISTTIQPRFLNTPCFGSKYNDFGKEIDPSIQVLQGDTKIIKKIKDKENLLAIALFDLWMANEDRNHNNYNLLLNTDPDYYFVPIDHEKCFNTNSLAPQRRLVMLTEDETLINTDLARLIFQHTKDLESKVDEIARNYYLWVPQCERNLESTINAMPEQWGIAKAEKISLLQSSLFDQSWITECETIFRDYTKRFLLS